MRSYNFKIVVIGDSGVGKTSLINQFISKKFDKDYISTIGVNILLKDIELEKDQEKYKIQMMFWDIGGQEKYTNVRHMFYRGANGAIVVYDLTRPVTFNAVPIFLKDLEDTLQKKVPFILLGNKVDLSDMRHITQEEGNNLGETTGSLAFFETSAKTGEKVEDSFRIIAEACIKVASK
ncbi:MAG: GTP-binding protein [Candidatus Helarchaeota archaeon]|nr:GTP-binding protein [Candidatus Helarchaeota archaeon]